MTLYSIRQAVILSCTLLCLFCGLSMGQAAAQDSKGALYTTNITVKPGQLAQLDILLDNTAAVRGIEFDIELPEGFTFKKSNAESVNYDVTRTSRMPSSMKVTHRLKNQQTATVWKVIVVSTTDPNAVIAAGQGTLLSLPLQITSNQQEGRYEVTIEHKVICYVSAVKEYPEGSTSALTVSRYQIGDADINGKVELADAKAIANAVVGLPPTKFSSLAADVNDNGTLTVADVTAVIQMAK